MTRKQPEAEADTDPIEQSRLYKSYQAGLKKLAKAQRDLLNAAFITLRNLVDEESKYIVEVFPEYTPHDASIHLANLFTLADKILGTKLYGKLEPDELIVLAFGLYGHDWGMAVSKDERDVLFTGENTENYALLPNEPEAFLKHLEEERRLGINDDEIFRDYVRATHGARSGARLRRQLEEIGGTFSEAVAKVAEGHSLDMRDIRDGSLYPTQYSVLTGSVNLGAISTYVRLVDLLDIGSNRTPFALWKFVSPRESKSQEEWKKHRALAPVTTHKLGNLRRVNVTGVTDDPDVYANLEDLRLWVDPQLRDCVTFLGQLEDKYGCGLDSGLSWNVEPKGFEPSAARFRFDRTAVLDLLIDEIYEGENHTFLRELLQNSVDAIEAREAILDSGRLDFDGRIDVKVSTNRAGLSVEWCDNGIGMNEEVVASYLATLGRSWYKSAEFTRAGFKSRPVSRFGVGVLSCFLVTDSLLIETRREPSYGGEHRGLSVRIPGRDRTFHIREKEGLEVGTTVHLEIKASVDPAVSKDSIVAYIKEMAGFVHHKIVLEVDGDFTEIGCASVDPVQSDSVWQRDAEVKLVMDRAGSQQTVDEEFRTITFELGGGGDTHEGYYSAAIPRRPEDVYARSAGIEFSSGSKVDLRSRYMSLDSVSGEELFVKGVRAEAGRASLLTERNSQVHDEDVMMTWRLLVNVKDPALVRPTLGRTRARSIDAAWLSELRNEIGEGLRKALYEPDDAIEAKGLALGAALRFGGLAVTSLFEWFTELEWPVIAITKDKGLTWTKLGAIINDGAILETPIEVDGMVSKLVSSSSQTVGLRQWRALEAWKGPPVLALGNGFGSHNVRPCEEAANAALPWVLSHFEYGATEVRFMTSPPNESMAYVCRVWKKGVDSLPTNVSKMELAKMWKDGKLRRTPDLLTSRVHHSLPQLVTFPEGAGKYAAIGSVFWNAGHPKVEQLVPALLGLSAEIEALGSGQAVREFRNTFRDPSRLYTRSEARREASADQAILRVEKALAFGRRLGMEFNVDALNEDDFVPGTLVDFHVLEREPSILDWLAPDAAVGVLSEDTAGGNR